MSKIYGFILPYGGEILIYGENLQSCIPYIHNVFDTVEQICEYCSLHSLRIVHKAPKNVCGLIAYLRVRRLIKKYSVCGSWDDI